MDMFRKKDIIAAIYREGGFSKASRKLHIAQPSLSVMVSGVMFSVMVFADWDGRWNVTL